MKAYVLHKDLIKVMDAESADQFTLLDTEALAKDKEYRALMREYKMEMAVLGFIEDEEYYTDAIQTIIERLGVDNE